MLHRQTINTLSFIIPVFLSCSVMAAGPPPASITQCKSKWIVTSAQGLNFGAFSIDSGTGTVKMDNVAGISTTGSLVINTSTTVIPSTFTVTLNNTKDPLVCGTYPFDISWAAGAQPGTLTGATPAMTLSNVLVSEPTLGLGPVALPQTLTTANLPITLTFQAELSATAGQTAGTFTSPLFTVDLTQGGTITSASNTGAATVLTPIGIVQNTALNFGTVAGGSLPGTVILDVLGNRTTTGDGQALTVGPGTAGQFTVSGEPNQTYALSIPEPVVLVSGANTVNVTTFTPTIPAGLGTLSGAGSQTFQVGAKLNLNALQPAGTYSATYSVTVNYN